MQNIGIKIKLGNLWSVLLMAAMVMMLAASAATACDSADEEEDKIASALYQAAMDNDTNTLQKLIDSKADLTRRILYMHHAIHTAAFMGHTEIVKMFIENGVPVDTQDPNGLTALHWAARNGQADVVRILIEHGADLNALSSGSKDLLCNGVWGAHDIELTFGQQAPAAINCKAKQTKTFEEQYKKVRSDYIYESARKCAMGLYVADMVLSPDDIQFSFREALETLNEPEVAKKLAAAGFDLDETWEGYCPLYTAISTGENWAVDNTIEHVLYRSAATENDFTPLRWARGNGHSDIVELLLAAGASTSGDPDKGGPHPVKITELKCEGLSDDLRDKVKAADFTGGSKSCGIMCQACEVCKCLTGEYTATDPALDYYLKEEDVSCVGMRYTLEAQGRTYDCQRPRLEYPTLKAPDDLHYPGAVTIGYSNEIFNQARMKSYALSTTHGFEDVIDYYETRLAAPVAERDGTIVFQRYLDKNRESFQSVEVYKKDDDEVFISIIIRSPY